MKRGTIILLVVVGLIVLIALSTFSFFKSTYNSLVNLDETVAGNWAEVENNLQRRYDLIPNLVNTVKGFANQEKMCCLVSPKHERRLAGLDPRMSASTLRMSCPVRCRACCSSSRTTLS